jgi:DNA-binding transcriptional ArsR family regulator
MQGPRLLWDYGTAYDLFISLMVLHKPSKYGLRGAWARGVRARLPAPARETLEQAENLVWWPYGWVNSLPKPKDGATALRVLEQIPPTERLPALALSPEIPGDVQHVLLGVAARRAWDAGELEVLATAAKRLTSKLRKSEELAEILDWWSRPAEFGERYLEALRAYYEVFFAEEETRIRPALRAALDRAQERAEGLDLPALLEELSLGLRLAELPRVSELVLAPSFWCTPLLVFASVSAERELILFGARPADASLVPGEVVPDVLMRALKALGDPTRLRILRYLAAEPLSPAQLARRLRLRAPTVIHHLDTLRLAELVYVTLEEGEKRCYAARPEAVNAACSALETFLANDKKEGPVEDC